MHKPTVTTSDFIACLRPHAGKHLIFDYAGKRIQPGYHVTEIKASTFRSLDCGANPQQWNETIVQLWDVADEPERGYMPIAKFLGIWDMVNRDVGLEGTAEIKFEWGDAETPAVHYTLDTLREEENAVVLSLEPVRATCKPRDHMWMEKIDSLAQIVSTCCAPMSVGGLIQIADTTSPITACCTTNGDMPCCN